MSRSHIHHGSITHHHGCIIPYIDHEFNTLLCAASPIEGHCLPVYPGIVHDFPSIFKRPTVQFLYFRPLPPFFPFPYKDLAKINTEIKLDNKNEKWRRINGRGPSISQAKQCALLPFRYSNKKGAHNPKEL